MAPFIFAVSGVKNSGKTTLITKLIPEFKADGFSVATIKHDGHDFHADVKGTDTERHMASGSDAIAIFSSSQYMIVNQKKNVLEDFLIEHFCDMDVIILEGFKQKTYPKIEVVRSGNSQYAVCNQKGLLAIITDLEELQATVPVIGINEINQIYYLIREYMRKENF